MGMNPNPSLPGDDDAITSLSSVVLSEKVPSTSDLLTKGRSCVIFFTSRSTSYLTWSEKDQGVTEQKRVKTFWTVEAIQRGYKAGERVGYKHTGGESGV